MDIYLILLTAVCSALSAALNYLKRSDKTESFDVGKFSWTVVSSFALVVIAQWTGLGPETLMASPLYALIGQYVENIAKLVYRRFQ